MEQMEQVYKNRMEQMEQVYKNRMEHNYFFI